MAVRMDVCDDRRKRRLLLLLEKLNDPSDSRLIFHAQFPF
jgi:hypothetical protein